MSGRRSLPHGHPLWIAPDREIYFVTISCAARHQEQLTLPTTSAALIDSIRYRTDLRHWFPHLFLLMPDHCHALITPFPDHPLAKTVTSWKRWTSRTLGIAWQRGFFEHRLRHEESFAEKSAYIWTNPVRAGLVDSPENWPHHWTANSPNG